MNDEVRLFDLRMADGSRHFGEFPECGGAAPDWDVLRAAIATLPGAVATGFVTDQVTEAWIDFTFAGERFSLNNQQGSWWCFVQRPEAPDEVLRTVLAHFAAALQSPLRQLLLAGPLAPGGFRVHVLEAGGREHCNDFTAMAPARQYADDAASETEHGPVYASVFDERLQLVHTGRHYGSSP